jgi:hypothetical protein
MTALAIALAAGLPATRAHADIHCADNWESGGMALESINGNMVSLGSCGSYSTPSGEWSTDSTSYTGNTVRRRTETASPGTWSDSYTGSTYSDPNGTVTGDVMIDSWNGTDSGQTAGVLIRRDPQSGNWYGATIGYDGQLHLRKMNNGTITTFTYVVNGYDLAAEPLNVMPGIWYRIRLETVNQYSGATLVGVQLNAYVNNALAATFVDDGTVAGALILNGSPAVGSKGVHAVWDNVVLGDGNDTGSFNDTVRHEESGESASLLPDDAMSVGGPVLACLSRGEEI